MWPEVTTPSLRRYRTLPQPVGTRFIQVVDLIVRVRVKVRRRKKKREDILNYILTEAS
jgi:hypothetical protein